MSFTSPKIEKGKNKNPDKVDEMPVESHDFDDLVASFPARKKSWRLDVEISSPNLPRDDDQKDDPDRDVRAVETRDHEEGRAELWRPPRVPPGSDPLQDQLAPLEGLHAHERGAEGR